MNVIDLGTKHGNAIDEFRKRAGATVLPAEEVRRFAPATCRGYERIEAEAYRPIVEAKGYQFAIANLADVTDLTRLPEAEVYLAWHVLEHLPNKACADLAVRAALTRARRLAWFRLPSFEPDTKQGEGALRQHGLRFSWTLWTGHPTAWLVEDCVNSIRGWQEENLGRTLELIVKPAAYVKHTDDWRVVPVNAPIDTNHYEPHLGPKPKRIRFNPFLVSEWEVIARFSCK